MMMTPHTLFPLILLVGLVGSSLAIPVPNGAEHGIDNAAPDFPRLQYRKVNDNIRNNPFAVPLEDRANEDVHEVKTRAGGRLGGGLPTGKLGTLSKKPQSTRPKTTVKPKPKKPNQTGTRTASKATKTAKTRKLTAGEAGSPAAISNRVPKSRTASVARTPAESKPTASRAGSLAETPARVPKSTRTASITRTPTASKSDAKSVNPTSTTSDIEPIPTPNVSPGSGAGFGTPGLESGLEPGLGIKAPLGTEPQTDTDVGESGPDETETDTDTEGPGPDETEQETGAEEPGLGETEPEAGIEPGLDETKPEADIEESASGLDETEPETGIQEPGLDETEPEPEAGIGEADLNRIGGKTPIEKDELESTLV